MTMAQARERVNAALGTLKALSDSTRLAMLSRLSAHPTRIVDVARTFGIPEPTGRVHFGGAVLRH